MIALIIVALVLGLAMMGLMGLAIAYNSLSLEKCPLWIDTLYNKIF